MVPILITNFTSLSLKPIGDAPREWKITDVTKCGVHVCPDLTTGLLPPSAERIVLGKVPSRFRVDHAVEACMVRVKVAILMVVLTVKFWEFFFQLCEDVSFDQHETSRSI